MRRHVASSSLASVALAAVATSAVLAQDAPRTGRPSVAQGFSAIQQAIKDGDAKLIKKVLPSSAIRGWSTLEREEARLWRFELGQKLSRASSGGTREAGQMGFVRMTLTSPAGTSELPLAFDGERWCVAAPWPYVVAGGQVATANAKAPAKVKLTARRAQGPYGTSAYSFTHVTQDPAQCKNRMDVWYCHNGDLHFGRSEAAATALTGLHAFDGLPGDAAWKYELNARSGSVYVVHVMRRDRMDFYVGMKVLSANADACEFEWRLVAAGLNAPKSVISPQPLVSPDPDDHCDGLCPKKGR